MKRVLLILGLVVVLASAGTTVALVVTDSGSGASDARRPLTSSTTTTASSSTTTSTTAPPLTTPPTSPSGIVQPVEARLPAPPPEGFADGASGPAISAIQERFIALRFDPGEIGGEFGTALRYAVEGLQKYRGLPVTGTIGAAEIDALNHFTYAEPLQAGGEPDRTEVDVAKQVMTLYEGGQPKVITTVSTGSGEEYCSNNRVVDPTERICEYANTPSGRFTYYLHRRGWDVGVNGAMFNPFYFNQGVAVHGLQSVPAYPASHGCVRIPMHIAEYWPTLVKRGDPVYVFGGKPFKVTSRESLLPPEPEPAPSTTPASSTTTTTTTTTPAPPPPTLQP